jgi:hypothetical protein
MKLTKLIHKHEKKIETVFLAIFFTLLVIKLAIVFFQNLALPPLTTDSWAYYINSKTIFEDFGFTNYIRQFQFLSDYNISFPPLYPLAIRLSTIFVDAGIYAGYLFNFIIAVAIGILLPKLTKLITGSALPGIFLLLLLLVNYHFLTELLGARSMILSLLLLIGLIYIFLQKQLTQRHIAAIGVLAGLLTLNRFDFLLPSVLLGFVLFFVAKLTKIRTGLIYSTVFLLVISPWIWYSYSHFGSWFVSDNSRSILLAAKTFTFDYYPNPEQIPTLFTQPFYWFAYRVIFKGGFSFIQFIKDIYYNPFFQQLFIGVGILLTTISFIISRGEKILLSKSKFEPLRRLALLAPVFLFQLFSIGLTGFLDMRYTLFFLFYVCLFLVGLVYLLLSTLLKPMYVVIFCLVFLTILFFEQIIFSIPSDFLQIAQQPLRINSQLLKPTGEYLHVTGLLSQVDQTPILLIDTNQVATVSAAQFAGLTNIKTVETPSNLNDDVFVSLINTYKINYVYTNCPKWKQALSEHFSVTQTVIPRLFKIDAATKSADLKSQKFNQNRDETYYQCSTSLSVDLIK